MRACVREPGGLGVVQDDDVVRDAGKDRSSSRVPTQDPLVAGMLVGAERTTVADRSVQVVVDPLGDVEELGVAFDHDPSGVDVDPAHVGEQRLQKLGDPAAGRRRVDVDHPSPCEERSRRHRACARTVRLVRDR